MNPLQQSIAIGPAGVSLFQVLLLVATMVALVAGTLLGRRHLTGIGDTLLNVLFIGIIGARLLFVLQYRESYDSLLAMADIRDGGFHITGGVVLALLYSLWALWRQPKQRRALAGGLLAGVVTWGVLTGGIFAISELSRPLPQALLTTLTGEPVTLPALAREAEQPLVVNIWATWCPPCRREMPVFAEAQHDREDVTFAFVNQGESAPLVEDFLAGQGLQLRNILLDAGGNLSEATGTRALPTTLFYNAEGQLVHTHIGELSRATLKSGLDRLTGKK